MKSIEKSLGLVADELSTASEAGKTSSPRPGAAPSAPEAKTPPPALKAEVPPPEQETARPPADEVTEEGLVNPRLVCLLDPRSEHAESYYRLRYRLETRRRKGSALVVGVTSPSQGDGKTLTGINLAGALAKDAGTRVLLLDLDLRDRGEGMSEYLGMSTAGERGVVDWIRDTVSDDTKLTHYLEKFNLHVMAAGSEPELPYELLKSSRLDELIRRVRDRYDFVIIDTPQILRLPDTELIARLVDGFLIVVKADETRQGRLEEALNLMTENKVFGLVFNAVTESQ